jgi:5-(carboxyamino)imidazole ribonucleotide synthase
MLAGRRPDAIAGPARHRQTTGPYTLGVPADPTLASARRFAPILPPATIGIVGGGQLGRMLGLAAREMGYGIAVLDPDPGCPAAAVADRVIVAPYDDAAAATELAEASGVVTYELEHVGVDLGRAIDERALLRPGLLALRVTQDRLAERRFLEGLGGPVAPWREVRTNEELAAAAAELGLPLRLKAARGGYDGRSQIRIASVGELEGALARLGRPVGDPTLVEAELDFEAELSVVVARGLDGGSAAYPLSLNRHDEGILVESVAPAPVPREIGAAAQELARSISVGLDFTGVMTVELFLLPDGSLVVNELAPRVHNSGHWTIEGAATSQFAQHVRAICGLPLGSAEAHGGAAMVNLLGTGPRREARLAGVAEALAGYGVTLHLYGKRQVFDRRKMGHVTALAPDGDVVAALERARAAAGRLSWADDGPEEAG